jgi:hypothetical protein
VMLADVSLVRSAVSLLKMVLAAAAVKKPKIVPVRNRIGRDRADE